LQDAYNYVAGYFERILDELQTPYNGLNQRQLLAAGEIITTQIFHFYLQSVGIQSKLLYAPEFMFINDEREPDIEKIEISIIPLIEDNHNQIIITQGFICTNHLGEMDNLNRGGSDYSATIIGAAIEAERIEIWTDINGMQNNDPRIVDKTFQLKAMSYDEAAELAYFGAKILHPECVWPAQAKNIPIWLKNTMNPGNNGTLIHSNVDNHEITAIAAKDGITAIKIRSGRMLNSHGFLARVFRIFEEHETSIDMITTSEVAISLTIDNPRRIDCIVEKLQKLGMVEVDQEQTIICVVGDFLANKYGYAARIFNELKEIPIRMISYGGSKNNITFLVSSSDKQRVLHILNQGLFENKNRGVVDYA